MPSSTRENPRTRRKKREDEDADGFNVPKSLPLRLRVKRVDEEELRNFPLYSSLHWISLFIPFCLIGHVVCFFSLQSSRGVLVQVLVRLTSWLMVNEDERNVLLVFAATFFLIAFIFTTQADRFFDIHLLTGYHQFCSNIESLMAENGLSVYKYTTARDPILLYVSISLLFSFIAAMLVFPNFRYANMYWNAQGGASKLTRLALHLTFLLPFLSLLSFTTPLKKELVLGPKKFFTEEQFDILRIYLALSSLIFRLIFRKPHLQAHLNLSDAKLNTLQRENGYIRNVALRAIIFRPKECSSRITTAAGLASIFDPTVCRAFWSLSLTFVTFTNVVLSLIGVMYNSYFLPL
ncbi:unnamed protein product [Angiostrongylus costaricensis]|uniref:Transmembrane protein n=1 Tax=Angiostrongylus costaricensis TaxID=334426 RepID=A0A0R3PVC3_ANGCS|nr:unnamed protein product [Angiostrongylus costaricensis]